MSGGLIAAAGSCGTFTQGGAALPAGLAPAASSISPIDAVATITLNSSGAYSATVSPGGSGATSGTWQLSGVNSDYECMLTGTGDNPGTLGTWQALSTTRSWSLQTVASGVKIFSGTLSIRRALGHNIVASCAAGISAARV